MIAALLVAAFVLGFVGFREHARAGGVTRSNSDLTYLTLQLFTLESGAVDGPVNPALQTARFLAPLASASAVIQAFLALFAVHVQRIGLGLRGGHVIVCGLGRKGARLVERLCEAGERVVVIEPEEHNHDLLHCRDLGAVVLIGTGHDRWTLRKAHITRAKTIMAVAGDDGMNVETAVRAHTLNRPRKQGSLRCIVHVAEPDLQTIFKQHAIYSDKDDPFELEFFNTYEIAARVMLRDPPVLQSVRVDEAPPRLLVVGLGHQGEAILCRAARDWRIDHPSSPKSLRITVVDLDAERERRRIERKHPDVAHGCELEFVSCDVRSPDFVRDLVLTRHADALTAVYICFDNDSLATATALTLRQHLPRGVPIIVRMSEETGLATLLGTKIDGDGVIAGVRAVGLLDIACNLDVVLGGTREVLAQAIHQGYIQHRLTSSTYQSNDPALAPWLQLPEALKESNRRQADQIPQRLESIGCRFQLRKASDISVIDFTADEIEKLAQEEHQRFVDERIAGGWTFGPVKDAAKRISPHLRPWRELTEEAREITRDSIRRLPAVLAKADYQILRNETGAAECAGTVSERLH